MKNILIIFLGRTNSGPVFSLELAKGFAKNGYRVYAVLSDYIENKEEWDNESLIYKRLYIKTYHNLTELVCKTPEFIFGIKKKFQEFCSDVNFEMAIITFFHPYNEFIWRMVQANHKMVICHDPHPHSGKNPIVAFLNKHQIRNTPEVIVLSKKYIEILHKEYHFPLQNIYYMKHGKMGSYKKKQRAGNIVTYRKDQINFLFFGRIELYKGVDILLKAFLNLSRNTKNITLTIAGKGDLTPYRNLYEGVENIRIYNDYIKEEEVGNFFEGNVVTVLPYTDATQSGVIPIAMEYGSPIIISDSEGLIEQLDEGSIGYIFERKNVQALEEIMKKFAFGEIDLETEKRKMSIYSEKLEWKNVIEEFLKQIHD